MSAHSSLSVSQAVRAHNAALTNLYLHHRETVLHIQNTLLTRILPNVLDELALGDRAYNWAQEWLQDELSIFRTLKRHEFTKAFALESLRTILTWRLTHLGGRDQTVVLPSPLHILPPPACDILRRPIVILRLAKLATLQKDPREYILRSVEGLRLNLHHINSSSSVSTPGPVFQYVLLVDMEGVSMSKSNLDLLTWYAHEVAPRYPGLFGTVFIINFSWTHSGIWSVIRHALPESVHYRIFFPSREVLHECISPSSLPQEYGGNLPRLPEVPNLLDTTQHVIRSPSLSPSRPSSKDQDGSASLSHLPEDCSVDHARRRKITSFAHFSPRSQFNPFYGYPINPEPYPPAPFPLPHLRHGRRRKRDLIRTLVALWWEKWRSRVSWTCSLLFIFFCARWWWRQRRKSVFFIRSRPNEV
ncbi:CRAL-TRIO domain-containing protein [Russula ochroleuca]|uniref:CRAL-TRIO domain-containing protein n=1 Tax=Russula ochroleuca TaxID=152965 RepID=A0A9P5TAP4_9AGAM|nr:CRAL-TRIO domain-containing protein [Russula ochroleuca]